MRGMLSTVWTGYKECGVDEGDVVLTRTGSHERVNSVVCTSGPDEPVSGVEECVVYEGEVALPRTRSCDSDKGVACTSRPDDPDGSCAEHGQIYESAVALHWTGADQTFNNVVSIVGSVADTSGDVIVMSSECREINKRELDKIRIRGVNPRWELK